MKDTEFITISRGLRINKLFEIYKEDREKASIYFRIANKRDLTHIYWVICENKNNLVIEKISKFYGISKTNKIYNSKKSLLKVIIKKGKSVYIKKDSKLLQINLPDFISCFSINNFNFKDRLKEFFLKIHPNIEWIWNEMESEGFVPKRSLNYIVKNKLFSPKKYLKKEFPEYPTKDIYIILKNCDLIYSPSTEEMLKASYSRREIFSNIPLYIKTLKNGTINKEKHKVSVPTLYHLFLKGLKESDIDYSVNIFQDLCEMAYKLKRKINPAWSNKRMKEEHDNLSKIITDLLSTMDNISLEINPVFNNVNLPVKNQILTTSGELTAEGKIMDHCVASYSNKINDGLCAIYHIEYEGIHYTLEIGNNLIINQLVGLNNRVYPPKKLVKMLTDYLEKVRIDKGISAPISPRRIREKEDGDLEYLLEPVNANIYHEDDLPF